MSNLIDWIWCRDKAEIEPIIFISVTVCYRLHQPGGVTSQEPGASMGTVSTHLFCCLETVDGFKSESFVEKESEGGNLYDIQYQY